MVSAAVLGCQGILERVAAGCINRVMKRMIDSTIRRRRPCFSSSARHCFPMNELGPARGDGEGPLNAASEMFWVMFVDQGLRSSFANPTGGILPAFTRRATS